MYHENLKDPYHATLLHSFLVVFGLLVAGNKSMMLADSVHGRHGTMGSAKTEEKYANVSEENKKEMRSFHEGLRLHDDRFLVLPHPRAADYYRHRATDPDRWLDGMNKLQRQLEDQGGLP